jgi:hypothetical protein
MPEEDTYRSVEVPLTPAGTLDIPVLFGAKPVARCLAEGICRHCGSDVDPQFLEAEEYSRPDYIREYRTSGLCRGCQDEVFAPAPEDEEYLQGEMP